MKKICFITAGYMTFASVCAAQALIPSPNNNNNFGTVNIGSAQQQAFIYTVSAPVAAVQVLTQGVPNLDFTAAADSCVNATSGSCSVMVKFSPKAPGMRLGAIVFLDPSNNVLNTTYLGGTGMGAAVANNSAAPVNLFPGGLQNLGAFTADAAGNLYVADVGLGPASQILKYFPATGSTSTMLGFGSNVNCFSMSLAVDGAGNLYASCVDYTFSSGVLYEFALNNPAPNIVQSGVAIVSLAVDANSNIYAGYSNSSVNEYAPGATRQIGSFGGIVYPAAIAVDSAGDVFVADGYAGTVTEFPTGGGSNTVVSGLDTPAGLAVDAAGDLFIGLADTYSGFGEVLQVPYGSQNQTVISQGYAEAVALDSAGNLFVYNPGGQAITEYPRGQSPWIGFPAIFIGTGETDAAESIQLQSTGNQTLMATGVGAVPNFSGSLMGCGSLAPGATCNATFNFLPANVGSLSASMPLLSNISTASLGFQNFSLAGAFIVAPGGVAPPNGNSCYGAYTGEFKGNINVSAGQVCQLNGGIVDGNITVTGGMLFLTNATVKGTVQIGGAASGAGSSDESICGTTIQGNLQVQNHKNNLTIGGAAAAGCGPNVITGNLQVQNNPAPVSISATAVKGNLQVQNNTAAMSVVGNLVGGNLQVQNNTVSSVVSSNTVAGNLQCSQDANLSGGGNTAKQNQGCPVSVQ